MGVSTHRIVLIFLVTNILIGMAMSMYFQPSTYDNSQIATGETIGQDLVNDQNTERGIFGGIWDTATRGFENTFGNTFGMGWKIFKLFWQGLNPFSFTPADFNTEMEKEIAQLVLLFRATLLIAVVFLELYMVIKNRKT